MPAAEALFRGLPALEAALGDVAERLRRVTVQVLAGGRSAGAGVVWRRRGLVITNAHVAAAPRAEVVLADGRAVAARVTARDPRRDLAMLTVSADDLEPALRVDARGLRPGELLVALGHPLGVANAVALGLVHRAPSGAPAPGGWLHADVRLAPGNSGGPLADVAGRIAGINAMIVGGLGIAVPTHVIEQFVQEVVGGGRGGARAA
ncbi:MAG TPA: trypsin-like peptidase domain-containing protein [Gemmatimonadales bacterium]|nr:trypsin-like peptidase domain-containing protein [Gemmatimonadales bacterium]